MVDFTFFNSFLVANWQQFVVFANWSACTLALIIFSFLPNWRDIQQIFDACKAHIFLSLTFVVLQNPHDCFAVLMLCSNRLW
jgi:ABC-type uncharacterized transport system fused permease/ATPase subunit